jgi:hypothetical protein
MNYVKQLVKRNTKKARLKGTIKRNTKKARLKTHYKNLIYYK